MRFEFDWKTYAEVSRQAVAEGCVLLRNDKKALPIRKGETVSVFGRIQFTYYKSGTGSGGMVNTPYAVSILDALKEEKEIILNEKLLKKYEEWVKENPFDTGMGWAMEPWCQKEMEISLELAKEAAEESDIALIILGRTAGEDKDNSAASGSYLLTKEEELMIKNVCAAFSRVAVILNVGNIIDMSFVDKYCPQAVMYVWQGGTEGGHGTVDVLTGRVNPSGRLTDTIAADIDDYPSTADFGDEVRNYYREDIYIGYRYFETIAKDKVLYPFGYGLSYTDFSYHVTDFQANEKAVTMQIAVKNIGEVSGKEVMEVYYNPPQGALSKPLRNLIRFAKTKELQPGETQILTITFDCKEMASFDDSGATGHPSCSVLEKGDYEIYVGEDVRNATYAGSTTIPQTMVTEELTEACAPVVAFERMKLSVDAEGNVLSRTEPVPLRTINPAKRMEENRPCESEYTGNQGYTYLDVIRGEVSDEDFLKQLTDEDLICMSRGEGMCSSKVTPGIAGSFGGVTEHLKSYGIPIAGCADGPSGIRMDCGTKAFALPNGTSLACTFNLALVEELYEWEGKELRENKIDTLLGPGINIHRNPLNGRNFEYFSEDPYLTGSMATAMLRGMGKYGVTGTIKHFAANNQEYRRHFVEAVVSQRALREIYLKGFEIAVKQGHAYSIMTTYGPINGIWTAGNYDLNTIILRKDWGYKGLVMTDWWARMNEEGKDTVSITKTTCMIRAQNDVYMVVGDASQNSNGDDTSEGLQTGAVTRGELLRNAKNILYVLKKSPVSARLLEGEDEITEQNRPKEEERRKNVMQEAEVRDETILNLAGLDTTAGTGNSFSLHIPEKGIYTIYFKMKSDLGELAQMTMSVLLNNVLGKSITINGTKGEWIEEKAEFEVHVAIENYLELYFAQSGIQLDEVRIKKTGEIQIPYLT